MPFLTQLDFREHPTDPEQFILNKELKYRGARDIFIVPKNFITDFASVPKLLWSIFPPYGKHLKAAVLHDFLYVVHMVSRKDADGLFYRTMKESGVTWRARPMWQAVRLFGGKAFNSKRKPGQNFYEGP